ncbi:hypothetical protein RchiOBHm_Chr5g0006301 [Rosa chinensis]|uniref:Transmembrane protein n=1 Tax=Rosa chinensis TaxID=74649 RepID=A0A2P6Q3J0_ROSCH|nr:uncharacterized protein LOC112166320 [Rosa chinensis]PRQ28743.1 hypothetical protein RchiOBHm_Chr5g0006301 [Rosa chinensis]
MEQTASHVWDLSSVSDLVFAETMKYFWASISSSPLYSSIVTLYSLILLYFPYHFLSIVFSPVLIITGIILISLIRLGASQSFEDDDLKEKEKDSILETEHSETNDSLEVVHEQIASVVQEEDHSFVTYRFETDESEMGFNQYPCFDDYFVEWNVKAPLEVIYEEYEGEEDEKDNREEHENQVLGLGRQPSLSLYYPESDSDTSSDGDFSVTGAWDSPENMCYKWEEDDREGLIEIALDGNKSSGLEFQVDEENLIEIDISPTRSNDFGGEKWMFSGEIRFS